MIALSLVAILATPSLPMQRSVPLPPDFEAASIAVEDIHAFAPPEAAAAPAPDGDPGEAEEIVVTASRHRANDPLRAVNAAAFALSEKVDDAILEPAAHVYEQAAPRPVRTGLRNFFANLREPVAFVNFLLQFKFGKAAETVGRFAINSTIGLAGVVDMARRCPFRLPRRPNGFSDTLGFYGVKQGPFLFLPLLRPTTLRDLVGGAVDGIASPVAIGGPFRNRAYIVISNVVRTLDRRVEMDEELREISKQPDPYAARRDRYLDQREARVRRLKGLGDPDAVVEETPYGQVDPSAPLPACPRRKASHAG